MPTFHRPLRAVAILAAARPRLRRPDACRGAHRHGLARQPVLLCSPPALSLWRPLGAERMATTRLFGAYQASRRPTARSSSVCNDRIRASCALSPRQLGADDRFRQSGAGGQSRLLIPLLQAKMAGWRSDALAEALESAGTRPARSTARRGLADPRWSNAASLDADAAGLARRRHRRPGAGGATGSPNGQGLTSASMPSYRAEADPLAASGQACRRL